MPRRKRPTPSLFEAFLDCLFSGSGNQNLGLGLITLIPMAAIPRVFHRLDGNQFQSIVVPYAKAGVLMFGLASATFLLAAAIHYWIEWIAGQSA